MAGPDSRDPLSIDAPPPDFVAACDGDLRGLRVGWSPDLGAAPVEPAVAELTRRAAGRFRDLGCDVDEARIDWGDPSGFHRAIYSVQHAARLGERAVARPDWIEPTLMRMVLEAGRLSAIEYAGALLARTTFAERVRLTFEQYDLLLTPQMPVAASSAEPGPFEGLADLGGRPAHSIFERLPFTYHFNLTGQPAASVPCGFTPEGLPVALQIVGRWHRETDVLRAAACFEALQPWARRRPPSRTEPGRLGGPAAPVRRADEDAAT